MIMQLLIYYILIFVGSLHAPLITISEPGVYTIGNNYTYTPTGPNDSIVLITTSSVIFDMSGYGLSQIGTDAGVNGITVNSNLSNIFIRNGIISNVTGTGILVEQGCKLVRLENITTYSADLCGIHLHGVNGNTTHFVKLEMIEIIHCAQGAQASAGILMDNCKSVVMNHSSIHACGSSSHNLTGIYLTSCTACMLNQVTFTDNIAGNATEQAQLKTIAIENSTKNIISNCSIENNSLLTASSLFVGIDVINSSSNIFKNCEVIANLAELISATCIGMRINTGQSFNNIFINPLVTNNQAHNITYGIYSDSSADNLILNPTIQSNISTSTVVAGICISSSTNIGVKDGIVSNNSGTYAIGVCIFSSTGVTVSRLTVENNIATVTAYGFYLDRCANCALQDNAASRNVGSDDFRSYGFFVTRQFQCGFLRNFAAGNCFNANANSQNRQFTPVSTFGAGFMVTNNVTNINGTNTITTNNSWTNFGITG